MRVVRILAFIIGLGMVAVLLGFIIVRVDLWLDRRQAK